MHAIAEKFFKVVALTRITFILLFLSNHCFSQFDIDNSFSNNMVLQRGRPIVIFGTGMPGKKLTLQCSDFYRSTTLVKSDSAWSFEIPSQKYSPDPFDIVLSDDIQNKSIKNILIGDVWLCAGQSNMEFPLSNDKYFAGSKSLQSNPGIRILNPQYVGKDFYGRPFSDSMKSRLQSGKYYEGSWQLADSTASTSMSAIGYYFAHIIQSETAVPIGIINIAVGGSPIESWISKASLSSSASFQNKLANNWMDNEALPVWIRQRAIENIGKTNLAHAFMPGYIYDHGIMPLMQHPIKGILWYQGESNAQELERVNEYLQLMKLLVADYRKGWSNPTLPFYFVQLSSIDSIQYKSQLWPLFRGYQLLAHQQIRNTGMVVSSDIGDKNNVHPRDKRTVAERLSRWALQDQYRKDVIVSGPIPTFQVC
jgi:sialate O-acetylesterase